MIQASERANYGVHANQISSWKTQLLVRPAGRTTKKAGAVPGLSSKLQRLSIHYAPPVSQEAENRKAEQLPQSDRAAAAVPR